MLPESEYCEFEDRWLIPNSVKADVHVQISVLHNGHNFLTMVLPTIVYCLVILRQKETENNYVNIYSQSRNVSDRVAS